MTIQRTRLAQGSSGMIKSVSRAIQQTSDSRRDLVLRDRLLDKFDARIEPTLMNNCVARIVCHEQNFQIGSSLDGFAREIASAHAWQYDIRQHEIDADVGLFDKAESGCRVMRGQYAVIQ